MDGEWDSTYNKGKTKLPALRAVPENINSAKWVEYGTTSVIDRQFGVYDPKIAKFATDIWDYEVEDFFHINDGSFKVSQKTLDDANAGKIIITELQISKTKDSEVSKDDLYNLNPIATPKIIVSRIDAHHIAITPNPDYLGDKGEPLFDSYGKPQEITAAKGVDWSNLYILDPELECKLIMQYLERNHNQRIASWEEKVEYAAIAGGALTKADIVNKVLGPLSSEYSGIYDPPDNAFPSQYVRWLRKAALIYLIETRSDDQQFCFRDLVREKEELLQALGDMIRTGDLASIYIGDLAGAILKLPDVGQETKTLDLYLGSKPERWYWDTDKQKLIPGWADLKGAVTVHVHKALWASGMEYSTSGGRFYITDGSNANSCNTSLPYNDDKYAKGQIAESLLFYVRGLAVLARAKDYNDLPTNIGFIFDQEEKPFGEIWKGYFESEKQDPSLNTVSNGIGRKKSYFWGIIGDWTLKIVYCPRARWFATIKAWDTADGDIFLPILSFAKI